MLGNTCKIALFAILSLFVAQNAAAKEWGEVSGWSIEENSDQDGCLVGMEFEGKGETMLVISKSLDDEAMITVQNRGWTATDGERYDVKLAVGEHEYTAKAVGVGKSYGHRGIVTGFNADLSWDFFNDFRTGRSLHVYIGDTLIDQLDLEGSGAATFRLNQCVAHLKSLKAAELREKNRWEHLPDDPFAKQPTQK